MKFKSLKKQGLVAVRIRLGLSQSQLAQKLGVCKATIAMAESGRRKLPTAALIKFAKLEMALITGAGKDSTIVREI